MKIKDILYHCTELLGLDYEGEILANVENEADLNTMPNSKEINRLLNLFKFVIQEICTNYIPVIDTVEINTVNKQYTLSTLNNYIRLRDVQKDGNFVKYKVKNRVLNVEEDGLYTVSYETYPDITNLLDEASFIDVINPDILIYGVCAYYCIAKGLFDDFEWYHDIFVEKAESVRGLKNFYLPQRRWE